MSDFEQVKIDGGQFAKIDAGLTAFGNGIFGLKGEVNQIRHAIEAQTADQGKWLAILNDTLSAGFAAVVAEIAKLNELPPQPNSLEVKFVFKVADDHQDEPFAISIGGVTDAEGQPIPDTSGLIVAVASSDESVVGVSFDPASNSGVASFGAPGVASLTASVTNAKGDILGSGAADFTVTTGDPAAVSDVKIAFSGLTEEPPA